MRDFTDALFNAYSTFLTQLAAFLPKLIGAIIILILGWLIAKIIRSLVIKVLQLIRLNLVAEKAGVEKFLQDGGLKKSAIEIIGSMFYWLIMLIVILATFNILGLTVASGLFNEVILFIPNIIVAILVLILGLFLANFVSQVLVTYLKNIEIEHAETICKIIKYVVIIFVISVTFTQLNIAKELITSTFLIAFGAIGLALALAFGIGGKDWAAEIIKKITKK